jgi:flagellar FliJ protein
VHPRIVLEMTELGKSESKKSLGKQIRLKRFRLAECQRRVAQLQLMIAEFDRRSSEVERDINFEHNRTKIHDPKHFAYSTFAKSLLERRENLKRSIQEFGVKLEDAKGEANEALDDLNKLELLQERKTLEEHANVTERTQQGEL